MLVDRVAPLEIERAILPAELHHVDARQIACRVVKVQKAALFCDLHLKEYLVPI